MTQLVINAVLEALPNGIWMTFSECVSTNGVADLVFGDLCVDNLALRRSLGFEPIVDALPMYCISLLGDLGPLDLREIASRLGYSPGYIRQRGLKPLCEGRLVSEKEGRFRLTIRLPRLFKRIVSVEVKRTSWRQGVYQARRYLQFSNGVFLALDSRVRHIIEPYRHELIDSSIGLIFADASERSAYKLTKPLWVEPSSRLATAVVSERLYEAMSKHPGPPYPCASGAHSPKL